MDHFFGGPDTLEKYYLVKKHMSSVVFYATNIG